jgi:SAM-dependent methyltransferase
MESNQLTDKQFWLNYWESKQNLVIPVGANYPFIPEIKALLQKNPIGSFLEIGGFPGYYSVWVHHRLPSTLLDFVIHEKILHQLEVANGLPAGSVGTIEADLFAYTPTQTYDLVASNGLIEHFNDTADIIQKHVQFLSEQGTLFITLPNFRGLNGWFQRTFDPENYAKHNIRCMDPDYLTQVGQALGLREVEARYHGRFMLWLENKSTQPLWVRALLKAVWLPLKVLFKVLPLETRWFSPYIVLTARR